MPGHSHTPGSLRQRNKVHKGGATSKRLVKKAQGGRVQSSEKVIARKNVKQDPVMSSKQMRKNKEEQTRKAKREESWLQRRVGGRDGAPKVVGFISLNEMCDLHQLIEGISSLADLTRETHPESSPLTGYSCTCVFQTHKQRLTLIPATRDMPQVLEVCRTCDVLAFVIHTEGPPDGWIDERGQLLLSAIRAQGVPGSLGLVQALGKYSGKAHSDARRMAMRTFADALGPEAKICETHSFPTVLRTLLCTAPKPLTWRNCRPYVLVHALEYVGEADEQGNVDIRAWGYVRGRPIFASQLVHIPNVGTVQMDRIEFAVDRCPLKPLRSRTEAQLGDGEVLAVADPEDQETLEMEAQADPMTVAGDMYIPTEDDVKAVQNTRIPDSAMRSQPQTVGDDVSDHMARWLDAAGIDIDESEDGDREYLFDSLESCHDAGDDEDQQEEFEDVGKDADDALEVDDQSIAQMEADDEVSKLHARAADDEAFPDEVETPVGVPARERFMRYRALQSFRTSPWHPKENLPADYARIYQFENFSHLQKRVQRALAVVDASQNRALLQMRAGTILTSEDGSEMFVEGEDAQSQLSAHTHKSTHTLTVPGHNNFVRDGVYMAMCLRSVPAQAFGEGRVIPPLCIFGSLPHENKLSVLHFHVTKTPYYNEVVKSKTPLLFSVGHRRWWGRPVFSSHSHRCDKHKFERFLPQSGTCCASVYGPATFLPAPLLLFIRDAAEEFQLVATGSLFSVDADRVILKRVVLTGYPIRSHKRTAVVKHMFYDPLDVRYFKPAELVTKHGLRGHIREPVGTHGLFKCSFSAPVKQHDTVCLNLYKRVYPKFPDEGRVVCL